MDKIRLIEEYLAKHLDRLDFIVEDVLFWLPDSYFYKPEINQGELFEIRRQLDMLVSKKNFPAYRNDTTIVYQHKKMLKKYEAQLAALVVKKRSQLREELLSETYEMKCACMISLIRAYDLLNRLRVYE